MSDIKNIFVSHYHTDAERIEDLKSLLGTHGMTMKDSSSILNHFENYREVKISEYNRYRTRWLEYNCVQI